MSHPQAEVFWQIPHCQDLQHDKFLTSPWGGWGGGHAWNWLRNPLSLISFEANFSFFSLAESPTHDLQMTAYKYNGLLMHNVVQLRLALSFSCSNILLMRKRTHAFLLVWKWQIASLPEDIPRPVTRKCTGCIRTPPQAPKVRILILNIQVKECSRLNWSFKLNSDI